ncbi:MAG: hypothetical protein J7500_11805 [Sphingomonas sp.]|uniref:hypothetical protein n=1 Tax=Sphingomonas sp. TaxID=28214 RepID=UPI001B1DE739|nr:hypothetical protein [Sphingomonas sp.]MBO9623384.1 hypothetical protein [Sphingomonas sp.]
MIQPIGAGRVQGASLGATGSVAPPGELAATAMTTLASRVATTLAKELGLTGQGRGRSGGLTGDLYGVEQISRELTSALGCTPADAGRIARALHEFTSEAASLLAAKPRSSVLGAVAGLHFNLVDHDGRPGSTDADYAFAAIEAGIFRLREEIPA